MGSSNVISLNSQNEKDKILLIKNTVARGATDNELALFLHRAKQLGLDPLSGQIHFVKRKVWSPTENSYIEVGTILIGIDGFRLIAERSGSYDGQDPMIYIVERQKQITETEYVLPNDIPIAARAAIYKKGCPRPFIVVAHYRDYVQTANGKPTRMWEKWPIMLAKCAEAAAFRKGFPEINLAEIYEYAEIPTEDVSNGISASIKSGSFSSQNSAEIAELKDTTKTPPSKQQKLAILTAAKKLGISEEKVERVISTISFDKASEIIRNLNKRDTSDFREVINEEIIEDVPELTLVEEEF